MPAPLPLPLLLLLLLLLPLLFCCPLQLWLVFQKDRRERCQQAENVCGNGSRYARLIKSPTQPDRVHPCQRRPPATNAVAHHVEPH